MSANGATTIVLVRHGRTPSTGAVLPGRAPGLDLSEAGREQAHRAAERIADLPRVDAVYCSPLERTRATAEPIAAARGLDPVADEGLLECDFGSWTGADLAELRTREQWATVQHAPAAFTFPGGEGFLGMQTRMIDTLAARHREHPGGTIVAVSHADPIKAVLAHVLGIHLDLFQRLVVSPCSLSVVRWGPGTPIALCVNSTGEPLGELVPS